MNYQFNESDIMLSLSNTNTHKPLVVGSNPSAATYFWV